MSFLNIDWAATELCYSLDSVPVEVFDRDNAMPAFVARRWFPGDEKKEPLQFGVPTRFICVSDKVAERYVRFRVFAARKALGG